MTNRQSISDTRRLQNEKQMSDRRHERDYAQAAKSKGMSNVAIARRMGISESKVRRLIAPEENEGK